WGKTIDSGWQDWDVEIHCHPWTVVQVATAQENHGSKKRLIKVRYNLRLSSTTRLLGVLGVLAAGTAALLVGWEAAAALGALPPFALGAWWLGTRRASRAVALFDGVAGSLQLIRCDANALPRPPRDEWRPDA